MSYEVKTGGVTGLTVYAIVTNSSNQVWRPATSSFETYSAANWANYATAVSLTEMGATGNYVGDFPTGITSAGTYGVTLYSRAGGSPAVSDTFLTMGAVNWNGTAEETRANVPYLTSTVQSSPTPTTTQFAGGTNLSSTDNAYANQQLIMLTGANIGQRRTITAYVGSTKTLTLERALAIAPSSTDQFAIV